MAEVLDEFIQQLFDSTPEDTPPITSSYQHDLELARIELIPGESIFYPGLHDADRHTLEAEIDSIFEAANSGNAYAKFLIYMAARNSVHNASPAEIDASGDHRWSLEYTLDLAEMDAAEQNESEPALTTPTKTTAWLDSLIAERELRLVEIAG